MSAKPFRARTHASMAPPLRRALPTTWLLATCVAWGALASAARAQVEEAPAEDDVFAEAIEQAQRRCVKVYGAGVGKVSGYASGILVSKEGHVLTASGVHLSAQRLRVTLPSGAQHEAVVLRRGEPLKLALLKIEAETPEFFVLPPKLQVHKGDWALAVTNAFKVAEGAEPLSATLGVISLRTRLEVKRGVQDIDYEGDVLLIDCVTGNPGAPGGAVVDAEGRLLGMVGRVLESKSTNTRVNYAVPADLLHAFVEGKPTEAVAASASRQGLADLGARLFTLGGRRGPAYVDRVAPQSPAEKAGLKPDDLIVSLGGRPVRDVQSYQEALAALAPNQETTVVVKRGQQILQFTITPLAKPE